ncbi:uncharacterized protein VTP21DRAFT_1193 [Calcarisporiella thermophila]|uniref:uncharacterized protein n=1 Tax=Calcarisporiella thermophila TaxID=911321 RepID=UPI0037432C01
MEDTLSRLPPGLVSQRKQAFATLRPSCVELTGFTAVTRANSKEVLKCLKELYAALQSIPDPSNTITKSLIDYVVLPLTHIIRLMNPPLDHVTEGLLRCFALLLEQTEWSTEYIEPDMFKQLAFFFALSAGGRKFIAKKDESLEPPSEETKLLGVQCLKFLLPSTPPDSQQEMNERDMTREFMRSFLVEMLQQQGMYSTITLCVTVLVEILQKDELTELRLAAIETLSKLIVGNLEVEVAIKVFPGVVTTLTKAVVLKRTETQHVIAAALGLLADLIIKVMNDEANKEFVVPLSTFEDLAAWSKSKNEELIEVERIGTRVAEGTNETLEDALEEISEAKTAPGLRRTPGWFNATREHLFALIAEMLTRRNHDSWRVRLAFVRAAHLILVHCSLSLSKCVPMLVETLVLFHGDEYSEVSSLARTYLSDIAKHPQIAAELVPMLKERFHTWLVALPRHLMSADETEKFNAINLLTGFACLLGGGIRTVLRTNMEKLVFPLLSALSFDESNLNLVEDIPLAVESGEVGTITDTSKSSKSTLPSRPRAFPRPNFLYIVEERNKTSLSRMLQTLGRFGDTETLVNYFFDFLHARDYANVHVQCAFIINELFAGIVSFTNEEVYGNENQLAAFTQETQRNDPPPVRRIAKFLVRQYLSLEALELPTTVQAGIKPIWALDELQKTTARLLPRSLPEAPLSTQTPNAVALTQCCILEGVARAADALGKDFSIELVDVLYPLLEKLGSSHPRVRAVALIALEHIASACAYSSVRTLVIENMDYVVNSTSRRLVFIQMHPNTPRVLAALVGVSGAAAVPYLDEPVEAILEALDECHLEEDICVELCGALGVIVRALADSVEEERDGDDIPGAEAVSAVNEGESGTVSLEIRDFITSHKARIAKEAIGGKATIEEIEEYFLQNQAKSKLEDVGGNEEEGICGQNDTNEDPQTLGHAYTTTIHIIDKVHHLLAAPSPQLRAQILRTISEALRVLKNKPRELHPLVHRIWPSIVHRLSETEEGFVMVAAVYLVGNLARMCGDFMIRRISDDAWPAFVRVLRTAVPDSRFTRTHRLLRAVLHALRDIVEHVPLSFTQNQDVVSASWPLLCTTDDEIRRETAELFLKIARREPDMVWTACCQLLPEKRRMNPDPGMAEKGFRSLTLPDYLWKGDGILEIAAEGVREILACINLDFLTMNIYRS